MAREQQEKKIGERAREKEEKEREEGGRERESCEREVFTKRVVEEGKRNKINRIK